MSYPEARIIKVHASKAHNDEIIAAALLLAYWDEYASIVRTNKIEPLDFEDRLVAVVDVGKVHDPAMMAFDHHQRRRNEKPECAFSLVAKYLGIADKLAKYEGWFELWRNIDATGPFNAAKLEGVDMEKALKWIPPVSDIFLDWFAEQEVIEPRTPGHDMILSWGKKLRKKFEDYEVFEKKVCENVIVVDDKIVYDMFAFGEEAFTFSDWFLKDHPETAALVRVNTRDPSGKECGIIRITGKDGGFDFDFGKVKTPSSFIHANGFYMTGDHKLVMEYLIEARI